MVLSAELPGRMPASRIKRFEPYHGWDRNFFLSYLGLIWFVILLGFVPDMIQHFQTHETAYPLVVHFHAAVFVGWLLLLTAQILLIRIKRRDIHKKLGIAGVGLAVAIVILGPITALTVDRQSLGLPGYQPQFLSVQLLDIIAFAGVAAAAIAMRSDPAAHKRLILLATLSIIDAGFSRTSLRHSLAMLLGNGFWPFMVEIYLANGLLIFGIGAYDLVTRRRLHPVYIAGVVWVSGNLILAGWLDSNPSWKPVAIGLISRWPSHGLQWPG
jgi:hypothetical protein